MPLPLSQARANGQYAQLRMVPVLTRRADSAPNAGTSNIVNAGPSGKSRGSAPTAGLIFVKFLKAGVRQSRTKYVKASRYNMAKFVEVFRCAGVDEEAIPNPGMIVERGSSNIVALSDGQGLHIDWSNKGIDIEELRDPTLIIQQKNNLRNFLAQPGVDSQMRDGLMPDILYGQPRFFKIYGKTLIPPPGALVQASSARKVEAKLEVVVFDRKFVKLSIRNVQVFDRKSGNKVFHAKKPVDPQKEWAAMNAIWTPQTVMAFDLISSDPVFIDDRVTSTREELAKAFKLVMSKEAPFPEEVDMKKLRNFFVKFKDDKADLTIFVVDKPRDGDAAPDGVTASDLGISLIAGNHTPTTFAHETGHYLLGDLGKDGSWHGLRHTHTSWDPNKRPLMRDGGGGWKIPFDLGKKVRTFSDRHGRARH
jgi:hypothetical protein